MTQNIWQVTNEVEGEMYDGSHYADENRAWLGALHIITDYAGDWSDYSSDDIAQFCALVEDGKFAEAVAHWNDNMTSACYVYVAGRDIDDECVTADSVKQFLRDYNSENLYTNES